MKPELTYDEEVTVEYYEETTIEVFMVASPKPKVKWYYINQLFSHLE